LSLNTARADYAGWADKITGETNAYPTTNALGYERTSIRDVARDAGVISITATRHRDGISSDQAAGTVVQSVPPRTAHPVLSTRMALMDGPDPVNTARLLDMLARHDVRATFGLVGWRARGHPHLCGRMAADGHTLCNHSWQHLMDLGHRPVVVRAVDRSAINAGSAVTRCATAKPATPTRRTRWQRWRPASVVNAGRRCRPARSPGDCGRTGLIRRPVADFTLAFTGLNAAVVPVSAPLGAAGTGRQVVVWLAWRRSWPAGWASRQSKPCMCGGPSAASRG
jgi:hypothetical protein